jgi:hypothetical protein
MLELKFYQANPMVIKTNTVPIASRVSDFIVPRPAAGG